MHERVVALIVAVDDRLLPWPRHEDSARGAVGHLFVVLTLVDVAGPVEDPQDARAAARLGAFANEIRNSADEDDREVLQVLAGHVAAAFPPGDGLLRHAEHLCDLLLR